MSALEVMRRRTGTLPSGSSARGMWRCFERGGRLAHRGPIEATHLVECRMESEGGVN